MSKAVPAILLFPVLLIFQLGCGGGGGEPKVIVRGKIHDGGKLLKVANPTLGAIEILFIEVKEDKSPGNPELANVKLEDGTFTVEGTDGKGIRPGKYRVVIRHFDPRPDDKLKGAFSEERSSIFRDVKEGTQVNLDISKPGAGT